MSLINSGFDGTVTERDFSRIMRGAGVRDAVETAAAWNVTQGTGRQVSVAPGVAYAAGVVSDSGVAILAALPTPVNGQWHLVVRRINWASNTVTVATIPHTTTTTTIPTAPPAGFPVFNDNTGVLVDQHLAWAWVRSTDTAVAVFDLRNVQGVQRTSVVVADFTALALLPAGPRFVGEQAFVVEGEVYMSWTGTVWRQVTTATFASTGARDTAYAKASAAFRIARVRALDAASNTEFIWTGAAWVTGPTNLSRQTFTGPVVPTSGVLNVAQTLSIPAVPWPRTLHLQAAQTISGGTTGNASVSTSFSVTAGTLTPLSPLTVNLVNNFLNRVTTSAFLQLAANTASVVTLVIGGGGAGIALSFSNGSIVAIAPGP